MTAHQSSHRFAASERGIALLTTILMMVLMSALLVGFTTAVMSDQSYRIIDRDRARAFYGAQSGIEKQNADLARLFINQVGPTDAQVAAIGNTPNRPVLPNITFVTSAASPAYSVTPLGQSSGIIQSGPYEGLMALKRQIQLDATARAVDGGEVHLRRIVEAVAIPVFQFGIFSDVDLAFNASDAFDFGGRVHTNGNLFLAEGSGNTLWLRDRVSAVRDIIRTHLTNGETIGAAGQTGTVNMTRGNMSGPFRALQTNEGSRTGNLGSAVNTSWPTVSLSTYVSKIRNGTTGVTPLNLDLVAANGANIALITRPPFNESINSIIFGERYFKKVSVRILLSDTASDITSLPTVSSTAPVNLNFGVNAPGAYVLPAGYVIGSAIPGGGTRPPMARSGGPYPDLPLNAINARVSNAIVTAGTNRTIPLDTNAARPFPDHFKLPINMTIWGNLGVGVGVPLSLNVNCTGKTETTLTGCTKPVLGPLVIPANSTIVGTSRGLDGGTVSLVLQNFNWPNTATPQTLTAAGAANTFPTAGMAINTFFIRNKNIQVTCRGYTNTAALRQFEQCNVPYQIAANDMFETGYLSAGGTPSIGGFLKVEIQRSADVWQDVTLEWLSYGISGENLLSTGRLCGDPTPNAIIRLQRLRDNTEPAANTSCSYAGSTQSTDHWPNVLFDVREAVSRDAAPAGHTNRVQLGGVMHYIALDAANLSKWFMRTAPYGAGTGNLAMREGGSPTAGFSVYFSDRRNNRNASGLETGEYGYEDVINPGNATGAPDGALNDGEDVNANGLLDTYGRLPSYLGTYNAVPPSPVTPMVAGATPLTFVSGGQAKVNRPLHFRRALKVYRGSIGTLVAPGLTIASENPVYLQGDWNASQATGWAGASVATSIAADTVVALSNSWNDLNSFGPVATDLDPYDITGRPRSSNTYYRVALISGKGRIFPKPPSGGGTYGTDGGAHNFIRYIEGDAAAGVNFSRYQGSMVTFYYTRQNLMPHKCCNGIIYGVPDREYLFDQNFLNPTLLPPLTPAFRDINALGFSQETRPGK